MYLNIRQRLSFLNNCEHGKYDLHFLNFNPDSIKKKYFKIQSKEINERNI